MINKYQSRPDNVVAIQFNYSPDGLKELDSFTGNGLFRSGPKRTPTMCGFAYVKIARENYALIVNDQDFVVKYEDGSFKTYSPIEFHKLFCVVN